MSEVTLTRRSLLTGLACSALGPVMSHVAGAQTLATVRAAGTFSDLFAEGYYATALDYFTAAGLDVSIERFPNSPPQMTALLGGSLDIGISDTISLGTAIAKGAPFVFIAAGGLHTAAAPATRLCVPIASPIKTATDLVGKTIAILGLHDLTEIATWAWLDRNGVRPDQVKFTEIPLPQVPGALARGAVDAGILAEPFFSQNNQKTIRELADVFTAIAPEFLISNWFTSQAYLDQNPAIVKKFVNVVYQTARWANSHHDESAPILADVTKIPLATIQGMTRTQFAVALEPRYIDPVFAVMQKFDLIDRKLTAASVSARIN